MALDDVEPAMAVVEAADAALAETGQLPPRTPPSDARLEATRLGHARFVQRDGPGAWVAVSEGRVVGVAESVRRENFWGLSMLFVHPEFQSRGVGGQLLKAAMGYAAGATQRMIQSSPDPRAMRRYFWPDWPCTRRPRWEANPTAGPSHPCCPVGTAMKGTSNWWPR